MPAASHEQDVSGWVGILLVWYWWHVLAVIELAQRHSSGGTIVLLAASVLLVFILLGCINCHGVNSYAARHMDTRPWSIYCSAIAENTSWLNTENRQVGGVSGLVLMPPGLCCPYSCLGSLLPMYAARHGSRALDSLARCHQPMPPSQGYQQMQHAAYMYVHHVLTIAANA